MVTPYGLMRRLQEKAAQNVHHDQNLPVACKLTLDLNTIHRKIWLSDGNRKMTCKEEEQHYPDHPDRFDGWPEVLCTDGLTGRSYWEVEWSGGSVALAVAYKSFGRKGWGDDSTFEFSDKSWCLQCQSDKYRIWHNRNVNEIPVPSSRRVRVCLDWPAGTLSFSSVSGNTLTPLYTINTKFTEPVYAGFKIWVGSSLSIC